MKKILAFAWLLCLSAFGATGDILGLSVPDNGWQIWVYADSLATNKLFTLGWNTNNFVDGDEKIVLTMNRPGFSADGTTNITVMTNYGTARIRFPDPGEAFPDVTLNGSVTLIKVALSDFVCVGDVFTAATIGASFYDAAGTPNNASSGLSVTNLSAQVYQKAIARFSEPGWQWITNDTLKLRVVGGHWSAANGNPLQSVHFFVKDESGDTYTTVVTNLTVDTSYGDSIPFPEYIATIDLTGTGLTHSNLLRCDFVAYPRIGNSAAVFDTRNDLWTFPSPLPHAHTNFWCRDLFASIAVVSTTGNDSNGKATNLFAGNYALVNTAHEFLTINGALAAVRGTNNALFGHQTCAGSTILVKTGIVNIQDGTGTVTGTGKAWVNIVEYPGDTVILSTNTGNATIGERTKITNIEINSASNDTLFANEDALWFDNCDLNAAGTATISACIEVWVTRGNIRVMAQGVHGGTGNMSWLLRGTSLDGLNSITIPWLGAGVSKRTDGGTSFAFNNDRSTWAAPAPDLQIWWYSFIGANSANTFGNVAGAFTITNGMLIANCVFEGIVTGQAFSVAGANFYTTNVVVWNSLLRGHRNQYFYNETGSLPMWRIGCVGKNNIHDAAGEATDIEGTDNGGRVGDWPVRWRVGHSGNIYMMMTNFTSHGEPEFIGLHSYRPAVSLRSPLGWPKFAEDQGFGNDGGATGNGKYFVYPDSPINSVQYRRDWVLPFGLEGRPRTASDPPGPYVLRWEKTATLRQSIGGVGGL